MEPAIEMPVNKPRGTMHTKPILFWPKPRSDIEPQLDREADDFLIVDTNCAYELQKLYKLRHDTRIFDPFPHKGRHYRAFSDHVMASDCRCHIVGLEACREILQALKDPSLAQSSTEELFAALKLAAPSSYGEVEAGSSRMLFSSPAVIKRGVKISIDWAYLNWANTSLLAILVFVAALIGNVLSHNNNLVSHNNNFVAAIVATLLFTALYVCVRANFSELFSAFAGRHHRAAENQPMATHGLIRSWLKKVS